MQHAPQSEYSQSFAAGFVQKWSLQVAIRSPVLPGATVVVSSCFHSITTCAAVGIANPANVAITKTILAQASTRRATVLAVIGELALTTVAIACGAIALVQEVFTDVATFLGRMSLATRTTATAAAVRAVPGCRIATLAVQSTTSERGPNSTFETRLSQAGLGCTRRYAMHGTYSIFWYECRELSAPVAWVQVLVELLMFNG